MLKSIGAVLAGPAHPPNRPRVRRGSRLKGSCEGTFWCRTDRRALRRVTIAARRYELAGRQSGRRNGPLGHVGLEVLELLANLVNHRSGRLEPSLAYLMRTLKRSRAAVVRALAALRAHGFLDWLRRHELIDLVEGPGPRVRQVSNAYRLSLPARAAQLLGQRGQDVPLPDDAAQELEDRAAELAAYKANLSLSELPLAEVEDDRLARVLGELGRAVEARAAQARLGQERESARQTEPQSKGFRSE